MSYPSGSNGKESACNAGHLSSIPGLGRSPRGVHGNPFQYSWLENPHGQRNLVDDSSWCHKELDTTERLSTAQHNKYKRNWYIIKLIKYNSKEKIRK